MIQITEKQYVIIMGRDLKKNLEEQHEKGGSQDGFYLLNVNYHKEGKERCQGVISGRIMKQIKENSK